MPPRLTAALLALGLAAAAALQAAAQQAQPQPLSEWTAASATSYAALGVSLPAVSWARFEFTLRARQAQGCLGRG